MTENEKYLNNLPGLLIFESDKDQYCVDVKDVQSVIKIDGIDYRVEHSSDLRPIVNSSDTEYFLFDSRLINGRKPTSDFLGKKVILCTLFSNRIGLVADNTIEFLSLDSIFIQKHVEFIEAGNSKFVKWRLEYQGRLIYYPDYEKIAKEFSTQGSFYSLLS